MSAPLPHIGEHTDAVRTLITAIFSAVILTAIGVIISGKLLAQRIPLNIKCGDKFNINLIVIKLSAKDDEVSLGFIAFIFILSMTILFGGEQASNAFQHKAGIDIGHWPSLCAISAFISIILSMILWIFGAFFPFTVFISDEDRKNQIDRLTKLMNTPHDDPPEKTNEAKP